MLHRFASLGLVTAMAASARAESPRVVRVPDVRPLPPLAAIVQLARERAPEVIEARSQVRIAESTYAGSRLSILGNPYLETHFEGAFDQPQPDRASLTGSLWFPLDISGQRGRRIAASDALVAWSAQSLEGSRALAAGQAVQAYGDVVVTAARVEAFETIVATSRAEAAVYQQRLAAGDASLQDARFAEVELARNELSLAEARADLTRALATLASTTGGILFSPPDRAPAEPPLPTASGPEGALAQRWAAQAPAVIAHAKEAAYFGQVRERDAREAHQPISVIVGGGRGGAGEARFDTGLAWTFPILRRNQGEQARASAEQDRALAMKDTRQRTIEAALRGLLVERAGVRQAVAELQAKGEPAARQAVEAAVASARVGKAELLRVLTARRDLSLLLGRKLDFLRREWSILGDIVSLTGELP